MCQSLPGVRSAFVKGYQALAVVKTGMRERCYFKHKDLIRVVYVNIKIAGRFVIFDTTCGRGYLSALGQEI